MPFPTGWPPRPATGVRSVRVFLSGTTTLLFEDNAFLFHGLTGANLLMPLPYVEHGSVAPVHSGTLSMPGTPSGGGRDPHDATYGMSIAPPFGQPEQPVPMLWCSTLIIANDSTTAGDVLEFSFDGVNVHGQILKGETPRTYRNRYEAGICFRAKAATGPNIAYRVEAW